MTKKATFQDIAKLLRNDPEAFTNALLGEVPTNRTGSQVRYFENQSLAVNTAGPSQGRFYSFTDTDAKGDMIDLVRWQHGLSDDKSGRHEALEIAKHHLGISDGKIDISKLPPEKTAEERESEIKAEEAKRIRTANWIWKNGSATSGKEEGMKYLNNRSITCELPSDTLRFRTLGRDDLQKMGVKPADIPPTPVTSLIFAARNEKGDITAVQQILTTEGKKVQFDNPKRTNGHMPGSSVMLGDPSKSEKMTLAEGPETALSVFQATGIPTKITLGSSNFTKVKIPDHISDLIIISDMEPTGSGLASALKTAQHFSRQGIEKTGIALPLKMNDGDYNDVHQEFGEDAVKAGVERAFYPPAREQDGTILVTPDARAAFHAWAKTGIEVAAKIPPKVGDKYRPFSIDNMIEERHNRVLIVANPSFEVKDEGIRNARPSLEIVTLHEDSREFRKLAKTKAGMQAALNAADIYAPDGFGKKEPVFFSLRREDADALKLDGHKSVAIRSSAINRIDFGFMENRHAIVSPLGNGTEQDANLTEKLDTSGAKTTRLTWQIFRGDEAVPRILRREIPDGYGASDAAKEGWTGDALRDLVDISRVNHQQIKGAENLKESLEAPNPIKHKSQEER